MTFLVLFISIGFSLLYGLVFTSRPISWTRTIIKTLPLTCLAAFSFLLFGPVLLTVGLALGAVGDGFLSRSGDKSFLLGLGSFLIGHICFAVLFFQIGNGISEITSAPWRMVVVAALLALTFVVRSKIRPALGALSVPVHIYILVIFLMGLAALTLPTSSPIAFAILGAMMFISSDAILSFELFVLDEAAPLRRFTSPLLWFLYWGGQFLIAASLLRIIG